MEKTQLLKNKLQIFAAKHAINFSRMGRSLDPNPLEKYVGRVNLYAAYCGRAISPAKTALLLQILDELQDDFGSESFDA